MRREATALAGQRMRLTLAVGLVVLVSMVFGFQMLIHRLGQMQWASESAQPMTLHVRSGAHFGSLVGQLEALGVTRRSLLWRAYGRWKGVSMQAGEYRWAWNEPLDHLLARMAKGNVVQHRFTIIEGWSIDDLRSALSADPRLIDGALELDNEALMIHLGCPSCPAEGYFLPETYSFERGHTDIALLRRAHQAMRGLLEEVWEERDPDLPIDRPEDLLVLASLIEKEAAIASERLEVAGVFARRLKNRMRLQTDPSVIYGLGDAYNGRLTRAHLRTDHPWNTYTRHGLPETPIALPGRESLRAAARPADGRTLYFVARGDGTHVFSETLEEHNQAVNRYIRGQGQ